VFFDFLLAHEVEELLVCCPQGLVEPQGYVKMLVLILVGLLRYHEALDPQLLQLGVFLDRFGRFLLGRRRLRERQEPILGLKLPLAVQLGCLRERRHCVPRCV